MSYRKPPSDDKSAPVDSSEWNVIDQHSGEKVSSKRVVLDDYGILTQDPDTLPIARQPSKPKKLPHIRPLVLTNFIPVQTYQSWSNIEDLWETISALWSADW